MKRFLEKLDVALGFVFVLMMILICVEVVGRKLFSFSTLISDEYCGYGLAVVSFLGLAGTMQAKAHINVDFLYVRFSPRTKAYADLFASVMAAAYAGTLTWVLIGREIYLFDTNTTSIFYSKTLLYIPHVALPLGGLVLFLCLSAQTISDVRNIRHPRERSEM